MDTEKIVIVDENDLCLGSMDKLAAHRRGVLHRAFSILLFDEEGRMLIQKRSGKKYHSPLLWANACCSHQREGETLAEAAQRRLYEELGLGGVPLEEAFVLRYRCAVGPGMTENEIDHVLFGHAGGMPIRFNRDEIEQVDWAGVETLKRNADNGFPYAYWFRLIIDRISENGIFANRVL